MIHRTTTTAESVIVLDVSVVLWVVAGTVGALVLTTIVLLVVRSARRRRAAPRTRTADGSGYSAGVARVRSRDGSDHGDGDGRGRRAVTRLFGQPARDIGLDVARGVALLALLAVVWFESPGGGAEPARRLAEIVGVDPDQGVAAAVARASDGTAALALVLISGIAIALSSGGAIPVEGVERLRFRMRLVVRAIVLLSIGGVAAFSGAAFAGLVATVAALSLVALAVVRWRARSLFLAAALWTVVVPVLAAGLSTIVEAAGTLVAPPLEWALGGAFPPVPLVGVLLAGMAMGRLDPARIGQRWIVFAAATGCALLAFGAGAVVPAQLGDSLPTALSTAPGSMMPLALLGTGGAALALITLALIVGRAMRWVLLLFSAAGSMASTLWIASLAVIGAVWLAGPSVASVGVAAVLNSGPLADLGESIPDLVRPTLVVAVLVLLVGIGCVVWRLILGDGPVERLVRVIGEATTRVPEDSVVSRDEARATEPSAPAESDFDAVIRGADTPRDATSPDTRPVRRPTVGPVDPVTAATQWTPGQALGRLPY